MISKLRSDPCFADCLLRFATNAGNSDQFFGAIDIGAVHFLGRDRQNRGK